LASPLDSDKSVPAAATDNAVMYWALRATVRITHVRQRRRRSDVCQTLRTVTFHILHIHSFTHRPTWMIYTDDWQR